MTAREQPARLEVSTIQPIPASERHGTARDLFTVWFGSNLMLLTIVTGGLAVTVFALPFGWGERVPGLGMACLRQSAGRHQSNESPKKPLNGGSFSCCFHMNHPNGSFELQRDEQVTDGIYAINRINLIPSAQSSLVSPPSFRRIGRCQE